MGLGKVDWGLREINEASEKLFWASDRLLKS